MNTPRKHADLIKQWADGAVIEFKDQDNKWLECHDNKPEWHDNLEYRVKPEIQPETITYRLWLCKSEDLYSIGIAEYEDNKNVYNREKDPSFVSWVGYWTTILVSDYLKK